MGARRYGDGKPVAMDAYHQSKNELDGLPNTVTEKSPSPHAEHLSYKSTSRQTSARAASSRLPRPTWAAWRPRGGRRRVKSIIAKYGPRQQLVPAAADLHLAHRHPHGRRRALTRHHGRVRGHVGGGRADVGRAAGGRHQAAELRTLRPGQDLVAGRLHTRKTTRARGAGSRLRGAEARVCAVGKASATRSCPGP